MLKSLEHIGGMYTKDTPINASDSNGNVIKWDPLQIEIINNYYNFETTDIVHMIKRVILERIKPIVNLNFKFVTNPSTAKIRVGFFKKSGVWSYVGKDDLKISPFDDKGVIVYTMNFQWFDIVTVLHEFGHMLGMIHEHQSPFGEQINWNYEVLHKWAAEIPRWSVEETNQQIVNKYDSTVLNGT